MDHITKRWDTFAQQNPMGYISTHSRNKSEDIFWQSGQETARFILDIVEPFLIERRNAIDIGCGIGRLTIPFAKIFETIQAVDASPVMLEHLRDNCRKFHIANIAPCLSDQSWENTPADLIYSILTFQHIESVSLIKEYLQRIARCVRGVAYLQFDTRPPSISYTIKMKLPDPLLPYTWKRGMRRIRQNPNEIRTWCAMSGLQIVKEIKPNTELHGFILTRSHE